MTESATTDSHADAVAEAKRTVERYFEAFNARDADQARDCLNFPHVRIASGRVFVMPSAEEHVAGFDFLERREGWHHSTLDSISAVQATHDKVHFAVSFTRHHADGSTYATYESMWVVTLVDGHWGVQARSSFAP